MEPRQMFEKKSFSFNTQRKVYVHNRSPEIIVSTSFINSIHTDDFSLTEWFSSKNHMPYTLLVSAEKGGASWSKKLHLLRTKDSTLIELKGADHNFSSPEITVELYQKTLDFIK
ncbi:MAG: hypothetical protein Q8L64_04700 [bacterium]|nr:hypothetical protein [bacterium]